MNPEVRLHLHPLLSVLGKLQAQPPPSLLLQTQGNLILRKWAGGEASEGYECRGTRGVGGQQRGSGPRSPAGRSHWESGKKREGKEALSLRAYNMPGPVLFCFYNLHSVKQSLISRSQVRMPSSREVSELLKVTHAVAELTFNLICLTPRGGSGRNCWGRVPGGRAGERSALPIALRGWLEGWWGLAWCYRGWYWFQSVPREQPHRSAQDLPHTPVRGEGLVHPETQREGQQVRGWPLLTQPCPAPHQPAPRRGAGRRY